MTNLKDYYGITITDPLFDPHLEGKLKKQFPKAEGMTNGIARVVIDKLDDYEPLIPAFQMISKYVKICLQICDSYLDGKLTDDEYNARELWMLENLSEYAPFVEIGNEVGPGNNWSSKNMLDRVERSAKLWVGHERILTSFWIRDIDEMRTWLNHNEIDCEHQLLSFYPNSLTDFNQLSLLREWCKDDRGTFSGLSECGMNEWQGKYSPKMEALVKRRAYAMGAPVMWWQFQEQAEY